MDHRYRLSLTRRVIIPFVAFLMLAVSGCGYFGYYMGTAHRNKTFETFPSMSGLNQVKPEDSLILAGKVSTLQKREEPLLLVAVSNRYRQNEKVALVQIPASTDEYMAMLPKGDYELFIVADLDKNGDFEWNEIVGHTRVSVSAEHAIDEAIVEGPVIPLDYNQPGKVDFHLSESVRPVSYVYNSLDNEFFDPKYGTMGLYNPSELMAHNQGIIFGLEGYSGEKTIVLFVHGISGTPRDWKYLTDGLDKSRFQPLFFYYPSGLQLDKIGALLAQVIESLDAHSKDGEHKIVLVAHSMGGLVALSAIKKLSEAGLPSSLKLYCSFSTPYDGNEAARKGIEIAPVVVPVWRDIASSSDFLRDLNSKPFPKRLPFYLFFSYLDTSKFKLGESSDGSVALRSQLLPALQESAVKVEGFNETHVGILNSEAARQVFLRTLDTVSPHRKTAAGRD
jgi:pimeloyl-ACP methyl ester carboxylesterase